MNTKTVFLYDENNAFAGVYEAQESPLEPDNFITPERSTEIEPPSFTEKQNCHFLEGAWLVSNIPEPIPETQADPTPEQLAWEAQLKKQKELESIVVTTQSGKRFDGDEIARSDMTTALIIASFSGQTSTTWKLADNSTATVTVQELQEALHLSLTEKGKIIGVIS